MKRITVLTEHISNKIAAGEVVERPASVVKELVENSLDAGAAAVTVETRGGGIDYIRVTDNGSGLVSDDAELAFLRHATSKISDAADLEHIETLGFRGEALASIAAVSRVTLKTRTHESDTGTVIKIDGGTVKERAQTGCIEGTTIEVAELFYNVPARLKFLKSPRAEAMQIADYISRLILANPGVSFRLIQNGKTVYQSAGDGNLYNAVYCVYGADILEKLRRVSYDDGYVKLDGYIGNDEAARSSRSYQSFFVNGRYIRSQKLSFAVQRAYDMRLMNGRFPLIVVNICISSREVDVNVHPNKLEVRFKDEDRITKALLYASRNALASPDTREFTPARALEEANAKAPNVYDEDTQRNDAAHIADVQSVSGENRARVPNPFFVSREPAAPIKVAEPVSYEIDASHYARTAREYEALNDLTDIPLISISTPAIKHERLQSSAHLGDLPYRVAGVLFSCYILVEQGSDVFFIDQHAAHERQLYDSISERGVNAQSQLLLTPMIEKLSPSEYGVLMDNIEQFRELGFEIDEFGALTVSIRAVPHILGSPETSAFLHDAISALSDRRIKLSATEMKRAALIKTACTYAVKAGDMLSNDEIEALLDACNKEGAPLTCPHGRPIMVRMSKNEFEKLFRRIV